RLSSLLKEFRSSSNQLVPATMQNVFAHLQQHVLVQRTKQREQIGNIYRFARCRKEAGLIQQSERIAQTAARSSDDKVERTVGDLDVFRRSNRAQMRQQIIMRRQAEHQSLAAADDSWDDFVFFGGGKNEHHIRWRIFNGLQKRVERFLG